MPDILAIPSDACGCSTCVPAVVEVGSVTNITVNGGLLVIRTGQVLPAVGQFDGQTYLIQDTGQEGYWDAPTQKWLATVGDPVTP